MNTTTYDLVIVGAGAAGLSAAQYGARANLKTLALDIAGGGGQMLNITQLENYPGVFPPISGYELTEIMANQAKDFGAEIVQTDVRSIVKEKDSFILQTGKGEIQAAAVVLATGAEHRKLGCKGEAELSGRGVSYCATCDGPFFRNKRIVVVGGGDAACDEAVYLAGLTDKVTVVHRKGQFRAQKAVAARVLNNKNITVRFNTVVSEIQGENKVASVILENTADGTKETFEAEAVFIYVGMNPRTELAPPEAKRDETGYLIAGEDCETTLPGFFCAGDVRAKDFRQIVTAAADGASAAQHAAQYISRLRDEVYA